MARELRLSLGRNLPPNQNLITTFQAFLFKVGAPFLQSLCRCFSRVFLQGFFVCVFVHEQQVYIGKEIRSTNVYQILVHYDEEI